MKNITIGIAVSLLLLLGSSAFAHGVTINHVIDNVTGDVLLNAKFDTGEIMSEAQVSIFAPNDLANPWLVAEADELGNFRFSPDEGIPGLWEVQVRQAGHGDILRLTLDEGVMASLSDARGAQGGFTVMQIVLMSASIIWGFVGTAFYFASRRPKAAEHESVTPMPSTLRQGTP